MSATHSHSGANITPQLDVMTDEPPLQPRTIQPSLHEINTNITDDIYNTIVRIIVHEAEFDYDLPFKIKGNRTASGTGFFIDLDGHILTCSHVVQSASHVYIEIPKEGKNQYKAHVLGICPQFDLAVIKIEDYKNQQSCTLHEAKDLPIKSGDDTYALGFPLGQDNLKVTKGIISGQQHNMYQIDTPINPGNSGGPLVKNNLVIGVNGAGILLANNIGYAVPISRYFAVKDLLYESKRLIHYPEIFGFEFQRTNQDFIDFFGYSCNVTLETPAEAKGAQGSKRKSSSPSQPRKSRRRYRGGQPVAQCGGVYVKRTFKKSPIDGIHMKRGDIVCAVNGVKVDHYGEFSQRWMNQKMSMSNMLFSLPLNQKVGIRFWSDKTRSLEDKNFVLREYKMPIRMVYPEFEKEAVEYEVIGGMVVMPLTLNHLKGWLRGGLNKYRKVENRHEPKLVLTSILMGSSLAISRTIGEKEVLDEINDIKVRTLKDFSKALCKPITKNGKQYIKIVTEDKNITILSVTSLIREEEHLQSVYKYTASPLLNKLVTSCG